MWLSPSVEDLLHVALAVTDDREEPAGDLQRLLPRPDLDQREAARRLLRLGEGTVDHGQLPAGRLDQGTLQLHPAGGQQHAGPGQLVDELAHLDVQGLVRRLLGLARHQEPHGRLLVSEVSAYPPSRVSAYTSNNPM